MDILVTENNYHHTFEENLIQDVVDFVNALFGAEYLDTEIPAVALEVYYVDFYRYHTESDDGIASLIAKSNWRARILHSILNGLEKIGAPKNRALFLKLIDGIADEMDKLKIEVTAEYIGRHDFEDNPKIMSLIEEFNAQQNRIKADEDLIDLLHAHIKTLPNLRVLPHEQYEEEFKVIMSSAPDQESRRAKSYQEWLDNENDEQKEIRRACALIDEHVVRWNAVDFEKYDEEKGVPDWNSIDLDREDDDDRVPFWYYQTDKGLRSTVFHNGKTIIFDVANETLLSKVDSAEGFEPWKAWH